MADPYFTTAHQAVLSAGSARVVSVTTHGATGNGTTDDLAAINAAIADLAESDVLHFPPGTYNVSAQVNFTSLSNFTVEGHGATVQGTDNTQKVLRFQSCSNFSVRGLGVRHQTATVRGDADYGMDFIACTDFVVRECRATNLTSMCFHMSGGARARFVNNVAGFNFADGIHIADAATDVVVSGNQIYEPGDDGVALFSVAAATGTVKRVTVSNNTIFSYNATSAGGRGVTVIGADEVSVTGNVIDGVAFAGVWVAYDSTYGSNGSLDVSVTGNTIRNANQNSVANYAAIQVNSDDAAHAIKRVLITGNVISTPRYRGMSITGVGVDQLDIRANSIIGPFTSNVAGISVTAVNVVTIEGNRVGYANDAGIFVDTTTVYARVRNNFVYYPNQRNSAGIFGVQNRALAGETANNTVISDPGKTALSSAISADTHAIDPTPVISSRKTGSYTLAIGDGGRAIEMNSASATTVTVPPAASVAFPAGTVMEVLRYGTGAVTIVAGAGVTLRSRGGLLAVGNQYGAVSIRSTNTADEWVVVGDLA